MSTRTAMTALQDAQARVAEALLETQLAADTLTPDELRQVRGTAVALDRLTDDLGALIGRINSARAAGDCAGRPSCHGHLHGAQCPSRRWVLM